MAVIQRVVNCNNQKIRAFMSSTLPTAAVTNRIVTSANMANVAYTIAAQPYCPSKITFTVTASGTADTMGTIALVGTDIFGVAQSETITPVAGSTVTSTKYYKTVTSATQTGWTIDAGAGNDTIVIGVPATCGIVCNGLPVSIYVITGNVWINPSTTAVADTTAIPLIAGDCVENLVVSNTLSLISDGSGGTFYAFVYEPVKY